MWPRPLPDVDLKDLTIHREQERELPKGRPRRRQVIRWGALAPMVLLLAGLAYWSSTSSPRSSDRPSEPTASAVGPATAPLPLVSAHLSANGYVVAQRQASVASKGTGRLEHLAVSIGDRVKEGQVLARLEHTDVDALLRQAQARLGVAKAALANAEVERLDATLSYDRTKALLTQQFVTRAEYDSAAARRHRAESSVRSAKAGVLAASAEVETVSAQVANTYIRAPFDGTVLKKFAEVGEVVAPLAASTISRGAVFLIADLAALQIEAEVSELQIGRVETGQAAEIMLDAMPGRTYRGEVAQILPTADRSKATVLTKIRILDRDGRVLPDMSARVVFLSEPSGPGT